MKRARWVGKEKLKEREEGRWRGWKRGVAVRVRGELKRPWKTGFEGRNEGFWKEEDSLKGKRRGQLKGREKRCAKGRKKMVVGEKTRRVEEK